METTALTLTSLPGEPETGIRTRIEAQPSGEFAKILQNQPAQAENLEGKPPERQEGDPQSATGKEILLLLLSVLPAPLREGEIPSGEEGSAAASGLSQKIQNLGSPQGPIPPFPPAGTGSGPTAVVPNERFVENSPPALVKPFNPGLSPNEGTLPPGPTAEILIPGNGPANSLPAGKARINSLDLRGWHNPDGGEGALEDLNNSTKVEPVNFDSEFWVTEKDPFQNDSNPGDVSKPENPKTGDLLGRLAGPVDGSGASRPAGEVRLEGTTGPNQLQKPEVSEQISQKMLWSFSQNEEKFRLLLDPPHLGSIYLEIQRDKEQVKATLWAENPHTKQVLEANQISIQKIIESEGFSLESFNVFVEQDLGAFQESRERMRNPESAASNRTAEANREVGDVPTAPPLFVRGSGGRLRSIDLII